MLVEFHTAQELLTIQLFRTGVLQAIIIWVQLLTQLLVKFNALQTQDALVLLSVRRMLSLDVQMARVVGFTLGLLMGKHLLALLQAAAMVLLRTTHFLFGQRMQMHP